MASVTNTALGLRSLLTRFAASVLFSVAFPPATPQRSGQAKPKQRLCGAPERGSPDTGVCCFQAGRSERGRATKQTETLAAEGTRPWRPRADLGRARPGLPLNAGWDANQAACGSWIRSMGRRERGTVSFHLTLSPYGFLALSPSTKFCGFPLLERRHSSPRSLSFFAPFQNVNLGSLSALASFVCCRGPWKCCPSSKTKASSEHSRSGPSGPGLGRPPTPRCSHGAGRERFPTVCFETVTPAPQKRRSCSRKTCDIGS